MAYDLAQLLASQADNPRANDIWLPPNWGQYWTPKLQAAQAGQGKATVAIVGDSITQGWRCSDNESKSYVALTKAYLQSRYGDGGGGFKTSQDGTAGGVTSGNPLAPVWTAAGPDRMVTVNGTSVLAGFPASPAIECTVMQTNAATASIMVRGTTAKLYIMAVNSSTFGGTGTATIDGAQSRGISSQGALGMQVTTWTGLTPGWHTIQITAAVTGSQGLYFCGATGENATGVVVNKFCRPGFASYATNNVVGQTFNAYGTAYGNGNSNLSAPAGQWCGGSQYPADLIVYAWGVNDAREGFSGDVWAQNTRRYLEDVLSGGTQQGATDILFLMHHVGTLEASTSNTRTYADVMGRAYSLARAYGAGVVNLWHLGRNSWNYWNSLGYWGDTATPGIAGSGGTDEIIHPSDAGHAYIASVLAPVLATV